MTAAETYSQLFKLASASNEVQEIKKLALSGWEILKHPATVGALGALTAIPAYFLGRSRGEAAAEEEKNRTRNLAFGAGIASGLVAPSILKSLSSATGLGLAPNEEATSI